MQIPRSRHLLDDLQEGLRILKAEAASWFAQGTEQVSLLKYKIQLKKLDYHLQACYRDIGEKIFLKMSAARDEGLPSEPSEVEEKELTSGHELRQLFDAVASLEQEKKELLDEMEEIKIWP